jgi:hypothetical protein
MVFHSSCWLSSLFFHIFCFLFLELNNLHCPIFKFSSNQILTRPNPSQLLR